MRVIFFMILPYLLAWSNAAHGQCATSQQATTTTVTTTTVKVMRPVTVTVMVPVQVRACVVEAAPACEVEADPCSTGQDGPFRRWRLRRALRRTFYASKIW